MIYFQDQEIVIRDIIQEDIVCLFSWWVDKELNQYDPRPLPSNSIELLRECQEFCRRFDTEFMSTGDFSGKHKYFIICNTENKAIGFVNIFSIDIEKKQCELGVTIGDKGYWRKGIAYKAINAAADYIFCHMNIDRIYIETGESNIPALMLFEKLGFIKCDEMIDEGFKFIVMERIEKNVI